MGFFSKIKKWFSPEKGGLTEPLILESKDSLIPESDVIETLPEEASTLPETVLTEEEQQFVQIKQFIESNDMSNHELAAMFMLGLGVKWDEEMYAVVAQSAEKMTFWAQQENNEPFINHYKQLIITPQFFGQYSEIAAFAEVLPLFVQLEELQWKAKHYWNQHPILVAASELPQLKRLYVQNCRMNFLPDSITQALGLEELYLTNNKLTEMPDSLGQLPNLRILDLSANTFTKCPRSICQLKRLEILRLDENPMTDIEPRMLGRLYRLKDLHLPKAVAKFNFNALKDWLPDVDFNKPYWKFDQ